MKNFDFLLNHDAGWASDSRSSAEVNLKKSSVKARQNPDKTSVKGRVLSRIGSFMSRQWKVVASIMLLLTLGVGQMWGAAKERYIYCGISEHYDNNKGSGWGFNFWGGTSEGVKSPTYIQDDYHDGRNYKVYRVQVYDDNNKAQFKGNSDWWIPDGGKSVTLNGTTDNAVYFSASENGWYGQFQKSFIVTSTASLAATKTQMTTAQSSTLTPSLSSNATYNEIKSTTYNVTTNPGSGGSVTSAGVFSATKAGTYTVTATVTYNAKDFSGITQTATATKTITVMGTPSVSLTVAKVNYDQITLTGTITNYNNSGSTASDMSEVGFYIGETKYTATYKSGSTFTKTITGLSANTAYANVKAFAKNAVAQIGNSSTTTVTTLADATYSVKVRVDHGDPAPHLYAWRDEDGYGGTGAANAASFAAAPSMTSLATATTYDWYYYDVHNKYEKFLFYKTGSSDQTADFAATRADDCYWYDESKGTKEARAATMDCPVFGSHLVLKVGGGSDTRYEMSGSGTVSVSRSLAAGTTYSVKIMYNTEYYGKASSSIARTGSTSSNSISGMSVDAAYITLTADLAGSYTFSFNTSSKTLSVTYPEAYRVNFSAITVGGGTGYSSAPTASYNSGAVSVTSGTTWIPTGTTVNFSAKSANDGYTFKGWYSTSTPNQADWTENRLATTASYSPTINSSAVKTIYAVYDENDYTVSVAKTTGGTLSSESDITGHKTTSADLPTATADPGYRFVNWTTTAGTLTNSTSATTGKINNLTSAATVTANFEPIWRIAGGNSESSDGADAMGDWSNSANKITNITSSAGAMTSGYVDVTLPANTDFQFKVYNASTTYWWGKTSTVTKITYENKATAVTLSNNDGNNQTILSAAAGSYRFTWDVTNSRVTVGYPTSWKITIGQKTVYDPNITNTSDATTTGGNVTAVDNSSNTITTGKYVANSASVTFTAHPATGYAFKGWYSDAACSSEYNHNGSTIVINDEAKTLTLSSITADKAVYAKYEEIMTRISVSSYGGKFKIDSGSAIDDYGSPYLQVGVHTTHTVAIASEDEGYYFSGWKLSVGSSCGETPVNFKISGTAENEDNRTVTVTGLGRADGCSTIEFLQPQFKILESIYFRNIFDNGTDPATHWSKVFVFFDVTWNDGSHCAETSANNSSKNLHIEMTEIGSSHIFRAYVPRYVTRNSKSNVAFANYDQATNSAALNPGKSGSYYGSMRDDYNLLHNMFVPNHVKEAYQGYYTDYYNKGYWMHYTISAGANAGYWIERHTETDTYSGKPSDQFVIVERAFDEHPSIRYRLRIDGMNKDQYAIFSEGGKKYKANATITYANCDNVPLVEDNGSDAYFTLTPTAEGEYIITIDQSGDVMKISVNYPVAVGDYVLENTYTGKKKTDPEVDSTYVTRSNIIKSIDAATKTRYSMFLSNAGTGTLKLRKCTAIVDGVPTWSVGDATNLAAVLTAVGTKPGVYQFDLAVDVANNVVASKVDSLRLYTGDYYLKTDAAPGGWVAYKNNAMDKNTVNFDRTAKTFDNYWCHHYASRDANIKCVIANDYCNQLSDTMKADGIARIYEHEPFVPIDGTSIRFSYNSATNTIGRAYLGASSFNNYLNIVPNAALTVYDKDGVDLYNKTGDDLAKTKFADNGDFVYEIDVKVYPGAQAGVQAVYNSGAPQIFLPKTDTVLGGTGSTKYDIRVVYDFKTNYMMSAFVLPAGEITDKLSNVDMLWVRHKEDSATQVLLGTGGELKNVRVIGALQFNYNEMCSNSTSGDKVDLSTWSPVSRPYLKYFVSFPFDVEMNSIFGLNQADYGLDYVIQKYNGTARAKEGLFMGDGDNYWENVQMGDTLFANEGYCVILDNDYARWDGTYDMWHNKSAGSSTFLYFPAMEEIESITNATCTTTVASHECKVDRTWAGSATKNHMQTDSHWNMIGSPLFHDSYIQSHEKADTFVLRSYYYLDYSENKWKAKAIRLEPKFKAMSSRLVQWCGTITWTTNSANNVFTAPRRTNDETKNYLANIELSYNGKVADWAYVELLETASDEFILREDMYKLYNSGIPQIYTFAGDYDVAYNGVPVKNQTIPVGLLIRKNGTYTFSMPTDFSGTVTLVDTYAQTRTNLALEDYEVYLEKGTINDRFYLEINIKTVVTSLENADGNNVLNDGGYHKFIRDDQMFILKNGVVYDAQGRKVE